MSDRIVICPRCKSKQLEISELWKDHSISWVQDRNGLTAKKGYLNPGDPYRVEAACLECSHTWKIRGALQITDIYPSLMRLDLHE